MMKFQCNSKLVKQWGVTASRLNITQIVFSCLIHSVPVLYYILAQNVLSNEGVKLLLLDNCWTEEVIVSILQENSKVIIENLTFSSRLPNSVSFCAFCDFSFLYLISTLRIGIVCQVSDLDDQWLIDWSLIMENIADWKFSRERSIERA